MASTRARYPAKSTPISAAEMVLALKQGVVSGQENATLIVHDFGIADVQKHMSINEHIFGLHAVMINDEFYGKLSPDHRQIVSEGARVSALVAGQDGALVADVTPFYA